GALFLSSGSTPQLPKEQLMPSLAQVLPGMPQWPVFTDVSVMSLLALVVALVTRYVPRATPSASSDITETSVNTGHCGMPGSTCASDGMSCSLGSCGVDPDERNSAPLSTAGRPRNRMLMPVPVTTSFALKRMQATAIR